MDKRPHIEKSRPDPSLNGVLGGPWCAYQSPLGTPVHFQSLVRDQWAVKTLFAAPATALGTRYILGNCPCVAHSFKVPSLGGCVWGGGEGETNEIFWQHTSHWGPQTDARLTSNSTV